MTRNILLLGRRGIIVEDAKKAINDPDVNIYTGTSIEDMRLVFGETAVDHVFMGAGIEIEKRLEIVKEVFERSQTTTVHLKDTTSGPQGFLPFVNGVLTGLR